MFSVVFVCQSVHQWGSPAITTWTCSNLFPWGHHTLTPNPGTSGYVQICSLEHDHVALPPPILQRPLPAWPRPQTFSSLFTLGLTTHHTGTPPPLERPERPFCIPALLVFQNVSTFIIFDYNDF